MCRKVPHAKHPRNFGGYSQRLFKRMRGNLPTCLYVMMVENKRRCLRLVRYRGSESWLVVREHVIITNVEMWANTSKYDLAKVNTSPAPRSAIKQVECREAIRARELRASRSANSRALLLDSRSYAIRKRVNERMNAWDGVKSPRGNDMYPCEHWEASKVLLRYNRVMYLPYKSAHMYRVLSVRRSIKL